MAVQKKASAKPAPSTKPLWQKLVTLDDVWSALRVKRCGPNALPPREGLSFRHSA